MLRSFYVFKSIYNFYLYVKFRMHNGLLSNQFQMFRKKFDSKIYIILCFMKIYVRIEIVPQVSSHMLLRLKPSFWEGNKNELHCILSSYFLR